jgi:hypothetical protein
MTDVKTTAAAPAPVTDLQLLRRTRLREALLASTSLLSDLVGIVIDYDVRLRNWAAATPLVLWEPTAPSANGKLTPSRPFGLALDTRRGRLIVGDQTAGCVLAIPLHNTADAVKPLRLSDTIVLIAASNSHARCRSEFGPPLCVADEDFACVENVAMDPVDDSVWVTATNAVIRIDEDKRTATKVVEPVPSSRAGGAMGRYGLAFASDGAVLYVSEQYSKSIFALTRGGGGDGVVVVADGVSGRGGRIGGPLRMGGSGGGVTLGRRTGCAVGRRAIGRDVPQYGSGHLCRLTRRSPLFRCGPGCGQGVGVGGAFVRGVWT